MNTRQQLETSIQEQFNKTAEEARTIIDVFLREKVLKIDVVTGNSSLVHGAFWEADVMDRALEIA